MLSEFGDTCEDSFVGSLIEEDSVVGFFFDFTLGPFLHRRQLTLAPPFLELAALAIDYLLFLVPAAALAMW